MIFLTMCLLASASLTRGQEQENKLIDRLLKPNMTLANSAQTKRFGVAREPTTKRASVRPFVIRQTQQFSQPAPAREFPTGQFEARQFRATDASAHVSSHSSYARNLGGFTTVSAPLRSAADDSDRRAGTHEFAPNRPFLGHGKSQKSLSAQNAPMTIEQVRELLNRNK
ncbi:MAG: hypothetical protein M3Z64_03790 [Verrucomicrobiota bacterium]|nr:hypothetical protein [Verrucomicrobiota bacterium]